VRKIYLLVILTFVASILLFISSFVYLDRYNHKTYHYNVSIEGQYAGSTRIDAFITEERRIYKSASSLPFNELFTEEKSRLDLSRDYELQDYQKELSANGAAYKFYLENKNGSISFLCRGQSRFAYLGNIPIWKKTFIFEEDSLLTYLPIIENYDFKRGGSQGFNSRICFPYKFIPPLKRFVTLTSIKDEYLKIDRRKIKTENLILKIKGYPQGSVWVAKSDRSVVLLEIPSIGLKFTRSFIPKELKPKERVIKNDAYISKDISFGGKTNQLAGTLTVPKKEGPSPAVLLIWGAGPHDRNYMGLFNSMADYLSTNGFCVLRFDKRGVASSGGSATSVTPDDEYGDLVWALNYLASQKDVDSQRIALIAHSEGAFNALKLASENNNIKKIVLMAPSIYPEGKISEEYLRYIAEKWKWGEDYVSLVKMCEKETAGKAGASTHDWGYIMGKRCYLKNMRPDASASSAAINSVAASVLTLTGKLDDEMPSQSAEMIDKALADSGNQDHSIRCYSYLGHFLGKKTSDGIYRTFYEPDKEVLVNIKDWLNVPVKEPAKEDISLTGAK